MIKRIPKWLKNRYAISILIFLIFLLFFDQNNIITQYAYHSQLKKLKAEKEYFVVQIKNTQQELNDLTQNPITLEKFAREKYFMKKEGEEIFVLTTE